jgi:hypothetical protein
MTVMAVRLVAFSALFGWTLLVFLLVVAKQAAAAATEMAPNEIPSSTPSMFQLNQHILVHVQTHILVFLRRDDPARTEPSVPPNLAHRLVHEKFDAQYLVSLDEFLSTSMSSSSHNNEESELRSLEQPIELRYEPVPNENGVWNGTAATSFVITNYVMNKGKQNRHWIVALWEVSNLQQRRRRRLLTRRLITLPVPSSEAQVHVVLQIQKTTTEKTPKRLVSFISSFYQENDGMRTAILTIFIVMGLLGLLGRKANQNRSNDQDHWNREVLYYSQEDEQENDWTEDARYDQGYEDDEYNPSNNELVQQGLISRPPDLERHVLHDLGATLLQSETNPVPWWNHDQSRHETHRNPCRSRASRQTIQQPTPQSSFINRIANLESERQRSTAASTKRVRFRNPISLEYQFENHNCDENDYMVAVQPEHGRTMDKEEPEPNWLHHDSRAATLALRAFHGNRISTNMETTASDGSPSSTQNERDPAPNYSEIPFQYGIQYDDFQCQDNVFRAATQDRSAIASSHVPSYLTEEFSAKDRKQPTVSNEGFPWSDDKEHPDSRSGFAKRYIPGPNKAILDNERGKNRKSSFMQNDFNSDSMEDVQVSEADQLETWRDKLCCTDDLVQRKDNPVHNSIEESSIQAGEVKASTAYDRFDDKTNGNDNASSSDADVRGEVNSNQDDLQMELPKNPVNTPVFSDASHQDIAPFVKCGDINASFSAAQTASTIGQDPRSHCMKASYQGNIQIDLIEVAQESDMQRTIQNDGCPESSEKGATRIDAESVADAPSENITFQDSGNESPQSLSLLPQNDAEISRFPDPLKRNKDETRDDSPPTLAAGLSVERTNTEEPGQNHNEVSNDESIFDDQVDNDETDTRDTGAFSAQERGEVEIFNACVLETAEKIRRTSPSRSWITAKEPMNEHIVTAGKVPLKTPTGIRVTDRNNRAFITTTSSKQGPHQKIAFDDIDSTNLSSHSARDSGLDPKRLEFEENRSPTMRTAEGKRKRSVFEAPSASNASHDIQSTGCNASNTCAKKMRVIDGSSKEEIIPVNSQNMDEPAERRQEILHIAYSKSEIEKKSMTSYSGTTTEIENMDFVDSAKDIALRQHRLASKPRHTSWILSPGFPPDNDSADSVHGEMNQQQAPIAHENDASTDEVTYESTMPADSHSSNELSELESHFTLAEDMYSRKFPKEKVAILPKGQVLPYICQKTCKMSASGTKDQALNDENLTELFRDSDSLVVAYIDPGNGVVEDEDCTEFDFRSDSLGIQHNPLASDLKNLPSVQRPIVDVFDFEAFESSEKHLPLKRSLESARHTEDKHNSGKENKRECQLYKEPDLLAGDRAKSIARLGDWAENLGKDKGNSHVVNGKELMRHGSDVSKVKSTLSSDDDSVVEIVGVSSGPLPDLPLSRSLLAIGEDMEKTDWVYRQKTRKKSRVPLNVIFIDASEELSQSMKTSSKDIQTCPKPKKSNDGSTQSSKTSRSSKKSPTLPPKDSSPAREVSETQSSCNKSETILLSSTLKLSSHGRTYRDKDSTPRQSSDPQFKDRVKRRKVRALRNKAKDCS